MEQAINWSVEAALCTACRENAGALQWLKEEARTQEVCLEAFCNDAEALQWVPEDVQTPEFFADAVQRRAWLLGAVPDRFKTEEMCLEAVKEDGLLLQEVPDELKTKEMCLEAVRTAGSALLDVPERLLSPALCLTAIECRPQSAENVLPDILLEPDSMEPKASLRSKFEASRNGQIVLNLARTARRFARGRQQEEEGRQGPSPF